MHNCPNPVGEEIPWGLGWQPVHPQWQVHMMNWLRVRQGLPAYTSEEIQGILAELEAQDSNKDGVAPGHVVEK